MVSRISISILTLLLYAQMSGQVQQVNIGDATLAYSENGTGQPLIFIHGGSGEFSDWNTLTDKFSKNFRVIAYSRRFNSPNQNKTVVEHFSEATEADDLAKLVRKLDLGKVHLVGHSFGSLTALAFATKYPDLTQSLVISEPPVMNWLPDLEGGQDEYEAFYNVLMRPVKIAFDLRDTNSVLRHITRYFFGEDMSTKPPAEVKSRFVNNFPEWKALVNSSSAFTTVRREDVASLTMPVYIVSGGKSYKSLHLINTELIRLLPKAGQFQVTDAAHDYWVTHTESVAGAVLGFLKNQGQ